MKKNCIALLLITIIVLSCSIFSPPLKASADMGPKPSVNVSFEGVTEECYVTLLSRASISGPWHVFSGEEEDLAIANEQYANKTPPEIFKKFINFKDANDYYFLQRVVKLSNQQTSNKFVWSYYPPSVFKVLIYFPSVDSFYCSEILESYAFNSYFSLNLGDFSITKSEQTQLLPTAKKSYDYFGEVIMMILRILATIAIELLIALLFTIRKKNLFIKIAIVNVITQVFLNVILNLLNYLDGAFVCLFAYIILEMIIAVVEGIAFSIIFVKSKEIKMPILKAIFYSLSANALSFLAGATWILLIPFSI